MEQFIEAVISSNTALVHKLVREINVNEFRGENSRNLAMYLLWRNRYYKDKRAETTMDIVDILVLNGLNLEAIDNNGCNLSDYISNFGWAPLWIHRNVDEKVKLVAPTGKMPTEQSRYKNPSPFAQFMRMNRYAKAFDTVLRFQWDNLISEYGPLLFIEILDRGTNNLYPSLQQLVDILGYENTPVANTIREASNRVN